MSWYSDAFKSNMSNVRTQDIQSSSGSAMKNFGDAFKDIGKMIVDGDSASKKSELLNMQLAEQKQKITDDTLLSKAKELGLKDENGNYTKDAFGTWKQAEQTKLDEQYAKDKADYDTRTISKLWTSEPQKQTVGDLSSKAKDEMDTYFQTKFNKEAENKAYSGNYKTFDEFKQDKSNADLLKYADGKTIADIETKIENVSGKLQKVQLEATNNKLEAEKNNILFLKEAFGETDIAKIKEIANKYNIDSTTLENLNKTISDKENKKIENEQKDKEIAIKQQTANDDKKYQEDSIKVKQEENQILKNKVAKASTPKAEKPIKFSQKEVEDSAKAWFGYDKNFKYSELTPTQQQSWDSAIISITNKSRELNKKPIEVLTSFPNYETRHGGTSTLNTTTTKQNWKNFQ